MADGNERMVIRLPASPPFMRAAQMAACALAAQLDFTYDRVSDLQLALGEACRHLTEDLPAASAPAVDLCFLVDEAKLAVEVRLLYPHHSGSHVVTQTPGPDADVRVALLQELVDEVRIVCDDRHGMCVTLNCFRSGLPRGNARA